MFFNLKEVLDLHLKALTEWKFRLFLKKPIKTIRWTSGPWVDFFSKGEYRISLQPFALSSGAEQKTPLRACNTWCTFHIAPKKRVELQLKIPSQVYLASIKTDLVNYLTGFLARLNSNTVIFTGQSFGDKLGEFYYHKTLKVDSASLPWCINHLKGPKFC